MPTVWWPSAWACMHVTSWHASHRGHLETKVDADGGYSGQLIQQLLDISWKPNLVHAAHLSRYHIEADEDFEFVVQPED